MREGSSTPGLKQVLWVAAGVVVATFLIVVVSWLFSPRPSGVEPGLKPAQIGEGEVRKSTFQTETPGPVHEVKPGTTNIEDLPTASAPVPSRPAPETPARPAEPAARPSPSTSPPTPATPAHNPPAPKAEPGNPPLPVPAGNKEVFGIQAGAFGSGANAKDAKKKLESKGFKVSLVLSGDRTKVIVKGYPDRASADKALASVRKCGFDGAFVVPLE